MLVEEEGAPCLANADADSDGTETLRPLQAAACTCRIAVGARAGNRVFTVQGTLPRAAIRTGADGLAKPCRYVT